MATDSTGSVQNSPVFNWGESATSPDQVRTTKTATFVSAGREYTVTVSFNRQAIRDCYDIEDDAVDDAMKDVLVKIGAEQLKNLAGFSISTSLSDVDHLTRFKALTEQGYHDIPDTLENDNRSLYNTINTVKNIFKSTFPQLQDSETETDENEDLSLRVIQSSLLGKNPLARDPDKLKVIYLANAAISEGMNSEDDIDIWNIQKENILKMLGEEIQDLNQDFQNDILKQLVNVKFADEVRVGLGWQGENDVILDISQGQIGDGRGQFACASICGEAILHCISGAKITTRENLAEIIEKGIKRHVEGNEGTEPPKAKYFEDLIEGLNGSLVENIEIIESKDILDNNDFYTFEEGQYVVVTGQPENKSAETILLYREGQSYYVFDSHTTKVNGVARGASVRHFSTAEAIRGYIDGKYPQEKQSGYLVTID